MCKLWILSSEIVYRHSFTFEFVNEKDNLQSFLLKLGKHIFLCAWRMFRLCKQYVGKLALFCSTVFYYSWPNFLIIVTDKGKYMLSILSLYFAHFDKNGFIGRSPENNSHNATKFCWEINLNRLILKHFHIESPFHYNTFCKILSGFKSKLENN